MSKLPQLLAPVTLLLLATAFLIPLAGCNQGTPVDAATIAKHRSKFVLADEPDDVLTVADVRVALLGEEHDPHAGHDHSQLDAGKKEGAEHDHDHDKHAHEKPDHDEHAGHDHDEHDHDEHDHDEHGHDEHGHDEHGHDEHGHDEHGHDEHGHTSKTLEVNVVGHIGGLTNPWGNSRPDYPFVKSEAMFFLADPLAVVENAESGHNHAPGEECAYCAAHAEDQANMLAVVQFVDQNGKVLPMDVRQLFDVKEQDTVVVHGKAHVTEGGILVVDAQGLYIRK